MLPMQYTLSSPLPSPHSPPFLLTHIAINIIVKSMIIATVVVVVVIVITAEGAHVNNCA